MPFFFFYKIREQKVRTGPVWSVGNSGRGEDVGKGCGKVNMVQILCTHVCKWKTRPLETIPGMGERGGEIKKNVEGGDLKYDIFDML
jgi:hypothetical protein